VAPQKLSPSLSYVSTHSVAICCDKCKNNLSAPEETESGEVQEPSLVSSYGSNGVEMIKRDLISQKLNFGTSDSGQCRNTSYVYCHFIKSGNFVLSL
jgi:hypothetical protein